MSVGTNRVCAYYSMVKSIESGDIKPTFLTEMIDKRRREERTLGTKPVVGVPKSRAKRKFIIGRRLRGRAVPTAVSAFGGFRI